MEKEICCTYVHLVFGARQTGKSTLLRKLLTDAVVWSDLSRPAERAEYLRNPDLLVQRCRALPKSRHSATVVVDEAKNVPAIFDGVQHLYDSDKRRYQQNVIPQIGAQVNVLLFIVIIIGGLGSTLGCFVGALLVGRWPTTPASWRRRWHCSPTSG